MSLPLITPQMIQGGAPNPMELMFQGIQSGIAMSRNRHQNNMDVAQLQLATDQFHAANFWQGVSASFQDRTQKRLEEESAMRKEEFGVRLPEMRAQADYNVQSLGFAEKLLPQKFEAEKAGYEAKVAKDEQSRIESTLFNTMSPDKQREAFDAKFNAEIAAAKEASRKAANAPNMEALNVTRSLAEIQNVQSLIKSREAEVGGEMFDPLDQLKKNNELTKQLNQTIESFGEKLRQAPAGDGKSGSMRSMMTDERGQEISFEKALSDPTHRKKMMEVFGKGDMTFIETLIGLRSLVQGESERLQKSIELSRGTPPTASRNPPDADQPYDPAAAVKFIMERAAEE